MGVVARALVLAVVLAGCAIEATPTGAPTPTPVNVAPEIPNLVGQGLSRGVRWRVTMERGDNGDLCFVSGWFPNPNGTTCGPWPADRGFVWNIGADATADKPTIVWGYASAEVAVVHVEMSQGSGFAVPVAVALLDDDTRAFALAFPPLLGIRTVVALDETGNELQTLPIFP